MRVVVERGDHRRLDGRGRDEPEVLARLEELPHERRVAGEERRAVPGEVRLLRERVDAQQPRVIAVGHERVEDARHALAGRRAGGCPALGLPPELGVALVIDEHRPERAGPGDRGAQSE